MRLNNLQQNDTWFIDINYSPKRISQKQFVTFFFSCRNNSKLPTKTEWEREENMQEKSMKFTPHHNTAKSKICLTPKNVHRKKKRHAIKMFSKIHSK